jgi:hypothetical protein
MLQRATAICEEDKFLPLEGVFIVLHDVAQKWV